MGDEPMWKTTARAMEAFLSVARKIPPTWTCVECKREFDNGPDGEMAEAVRTEVVRQRDGYMLRRIVGDLCKDCTYPSPDPSP